MSIENDKNGHEYSQLLERHNPVAFYPVGANTILTLRRPSDTPRVWS